MSTTDIGLEPLVAAWTELRSYLERRSRELNDEVRNYPTPIARCDEQLTKLIEQRTRAINDLQRVVDASPVQAGGADPRWPATLAALLADSAATDDETEIALRARVRAALSSLHQPA